MDREVVLSEGMSLGKIAPAVLDAYEEGASRHLLRWFMAPTDRRLVLMGVTHAGLGITVRYSDADLDNLLYVEFAWGGEATKAWEATLVLAS